MLGLQYQGLDCIEIADRNVSDFDYSMAKYVSIEILERCRAVFISLKS